MMIYLGSITRDENWLRIWQSDWRTGPANLIKIL